MGQEKLSPIDQHHVGNLVTFRVGNRELSSADVPFKSVRITHSIEQLAGTFSIDVSGGWAKPLGFGVEKGMSCEVFIGNDAVITGYLDNIEVQASPTQHTISFDGRDKSGDLVDCSAPPREWVGMSFEHVAVELCRPFGVDLYRQVKTGPAGYITPDKTHEPCPIERCHNGGEKLPRKATNSGETIHRTLEKLAKLQGVLLISDRKGGLLVTRAGLGGRAVDALAMGSNIKDIRLQESFVNLFSDITVKGQANGATSTAAGTPVFTSVQSVKPSASIKRKAEVRSGSVLPTNQVTRTTAADRYRPLIIMADSQADAKRCNEIAAWEASTREAKSKRITVVVQGWRQSDGSLWSINTLVRLRCPWVREDEDLLICACEYTLDASGGTTTRMQLTSPDAYTVLKEIPKPTAPASGGGVPSNGKKPPRFTAANTQPPNR